MANVRSSSQRANSRIGKPAQSKTSIAPKISTKAAAGKAVQTRAVGNTSRNLSAKKNNAPQNGANDSVEASKHSPTDGEEIGGQAEASADPSVPGGDGKEDAVAEEEELSFKDPETTFLVDTRPKKIWIQANGPEGQTNKVQIPRKSMVNEIRKALCAVTSRAAGQTEIKIDGIVMADSRLRVFNDRDPPYIVEWFSENRMGALMRKHRLRNFAARSAGVSGLNRTILHFAAMQGDTDLILEVLEDPRMQPMIYSLVNAQDAFGDTAMTIAAALNFFDIVETMIDKQGDMEKQNLCGRTAMQLAAEHGHGQTVMSLLRGGAIWDKPNKGTSFPTAKHLAELNKRVGALKAMDDFVKDKTEDPFKDLGSEESESGSDSPVNGNEKPTETYQTAAPTEGTAELSAS
eukprot:TRINITY_DN18244_c0_g1_i1.p1 TRINITY_DN18244_c0_g1~~TRINITY_DN18244_c0_g1_i1.p1  ORF type:complete len:404 (-),score=72.34 TRINITY_DN18244_c0_g1_i1:224-1435(-)